jgi:RHS repeat-associated protein
VDEKFTGEVRDTETLNDFFNARYYTAPLMRFLSSDPRNAGADPTDPQTWNGYSYVRNDPPNSVDPSGACDVLVNGVTQSPGWAPIDNFGANMINVFPFAGMSVGQALLSIGFGDAGSNATYSALKSALAQTPAGQSVNVFPISGGAQSFTSAYNSLSPAEQSRIGNVSYMIAGSNAATLPSGTGTTNWIMDWSDPIFPAGRPQGSYITYFAYNSFHNPATILGDFQSLLNSMRGSPCSNPQVVVPQSSNKGTAISTIHYGPVGGGGGGSSGAPGGTWIFQPTYGEEGNSTGGFWIWTPPPGPQPMRVN